ncbi:uncharacterized protein LOC117589072 isoform X4 [Drosophila guanche]|uniref:uncharacterized protein LOC117589072 isoform X4 n=1 Tax=Drosophila guanche TaxID=7266 RepID=UPI001470B1AE|nr:uncharacterized protein LOC117589072 isoform X4 [Drosophila guanche]
MDKGNRSPRNTSPMEQTSLGILSLDNLKVFGDLSSFSRSGNGSGMGLREASNVHERLRAERLRAKETLEKARPRSSQAKGQPTKGRPSALPSNSSNISELVTDETIDLNSSGSFAMPTPAQKGRNISFEPAEITGRSTLCRSDRGRKVVSVSDIIKTSFVEKARLLEKKLHNGSQANAGCNCSNTKSKSNVNVSSLTESESSFNSSHSLPRTADLSNLSLNGGGGFSFGSESAAAGQDMDESFAPAELMQSKLVQGEISWAQEFTAMPTATLSNQAMQKIAAPPPASDIETSVSNSVLAGDPDFSLGYYFQTRSENIWNIVSNDPPERMLEENPPATPTFNSLVANTPQPDNKTYTKAEASNMGSKLGQNLMKKMQNAKKKFQTAIQPKSGAGAETMRPPSSSEILSLSAIDKALRDLDFNSDTSTLEVVERLRKHGRGQGQGQQLHADEDKENDSFNAERTLCDSHKLTDTMSFTDSVLDSTDFKHLQQSVSRKALSPLADKPQILVSCADNDSVLADVDEWPSSPLKSPRRVPFVGISVDSTVLMKLRLSEAFEVRPSKLILPPHTESTVQVIFRPNREDMKNILKKTSQVLTLANMRIFCGDEPNRQRMRHLVHRMSSRQREKLTSAMLDSLWSPFPDEQPVRNICQLNEPPEFILDLVTVVKIIDVALTLNRDFDESAETSLLFLPEAEETVLFRTICAANSPTPTQSNMLEPVDELEHEADTTTMLLPVERNWSVQPASIELGAGSIAKLSVKNCFRSGQLIEVHCNVSDFVQISPRECYIAPDGGEVEIKVRLLRSPRREGLKREPLIIVSMENERINVPVSVKF